MLNREVVQIRIGREIETEVLPRYKRPFPRFPRARDKCGRYRVMANAFYGRVDGRAICYDEYIHRVREGASPPRIIHGPLHATRVALWSGLLWVLFKDCGLAVIDDVSTLQLAAAFHDVARQDEGIDRWEPESERTFIRWLKHRTPSAHIGHDCLAGATRSSILSIIKDADTIDILRVLPSLRAFEPARLSFWCSAKIPHPVREKLVNEAYIFIRLTEQPDCKRELEGSGALYFSLMQVIVQTHKEFMCFPLLYELVINLTGEVEL